MTNLHFNNMKVVIAKGVRSVNSQELAERLNVAGDAQREGNFGLADTIIQQVLSEYSPVDLPVDILCPLTVRALNSLYNHGVTTIAKLGECTLFGVSHWYNFGPLSITFMGERMRVFGINLAEQQDYKWIKERVIKNRPRLDRCLLLPTFALPNDSPIENPFQNYEGPLCGARAPSASGRGHDFYPGTEPPCALPSNHPGWHLSLQEINDERLLERWQHSVLIWETMQAAPCTLLVAKTQGRSDDI